MKRIARIALVLAVVPMASAANAQTIAGSDVHQPAPLQPVVAKVLRAETKADIRFNPPGRGLFLRQFEFAWSDRNNRPGGSLPVDHKIREVGFLPSKQRVGVRYRDGNGGDRFNFKAQYSGVPLRANQGFGRQQRAVKRGCKGTCYVPISKPQGSKVFLLQGFLVSRKGGDSNVREITVRPEVDRGRIKVTYKDNGSFDFDVEVRYVYVAKSYISKEATAEGTTNKLGYFRLPVPRGVHAIQGFSFRFDNGDHHLYSMGISDKDNELNVAFFDSNGDDPITVRVDYATVDMRTLKAYR